MGLFSSFSLWELVAVGLVLTGLLRCARHHRAPIPARAGGCYRNMLHQSPQCRESQSPAITSAWEGPAASTEPFCPTLLPAWEHLCYSQVCVSKPAGPDAPSPAASAAARGALGPALRSPCSVGGTRQGSPHPACAQCELGQHCSSSPGPGAPLQITPSRLPSSRHKVAPARQGQRLRRVAPRHGGQVGKRRLNPLSTAHLQIHQPCGLSSRPAPCQRTRRTRSLPSGRQQSRASGVRPRQRQ